MLMLAGLAVATDNTRASARREDNVTVLVFGDSWGQVGPSWHALEDMFVAHGVSADVQSSAVGGTRACQWAQDPQSLVKAAQERFGDAGPDYVWYTAGGNDLEASAYQQCSKNASSMDEAINTCLRKATDVINACTDTLLTELWTVYPSAKVMQCGYDIPCEEGQCATQSRNPYCGNNVTCQNVGTVAWQPMLLELEDKYPGRYAGLNVLGAVQKAGGVPGADVGAPDLTRGSPCGLMTSCVHPTYGKAGASAVGEAFWELYFSKQLLARP